MPTTLVARVLIRRSSASLIGGHFVGRFGETLILNSAADLTTNTHQQDGLGEILGTIGRLTVRSRLLGLRPAPPCRSAPHRLRSVKHGFQTGRRLARTPVKDSCSFRLLRRSQRGRVCIRGWIKRESAERNFTTRRRFSEGKLSPALFHRIDAFI
jgi:hypothetical protein